jgi:hypothetical protein
MARRYPSSSGGGSPNAILVVFLVLFFLSTLGLGTWIYMIFSERHKWQSDAKKAEVAAKAAKDAEKEAQFLASELKRMLVDPLPNPKKLEDLGLKKVDEDEFTEWKVTREEWIEPGEKLAFKADSKFKDNKAAKLLEFWVKRAYEDLGWNPATHRYKTTFAKRYEEVLARLKTVEAELAAAQQKNVVLDQEKRSLEKKYEEYHTKQLDEIKTQGKNAIKATQAALTEMTKNVEAYNDQVAQNEKLRNERDTTQKKLDLEEKKVSMLQRRLREATKGAGGEPVPDKDDKGQPKGPSIVKGVVPHALLLDISKGKPLWDRPRGEIIKIDEKERRVYINKGAADGVKTGLTFNVFGPSWDGRAEGPFKGTIEVLRVEPRTSMARITSLYDAVGNEVSLNDPSPSKIIRGGSNPWKEKDLIFNLGWGARVAIAGVINFNGQGAESPAAQYDDLQHFIRVVESEGVTVDAYVDPRNGELKGALRPQTAYLIVGMPAFGKKADDPRAKAVNDKLNELRKQVVNRGMFMISPDNFLNVVGFRRHRSKTDAELSLFRPGMPSGGFSYTGVAGVEGGAGGPVTELTGRWSGKVAGGGQLRLTFKGEGGCLWQIVIGAEPPLTGFTNVARAGKDFGAVIQNRPVTLRITGAGTQLEVTGGGMQATLSRE